MTTMGEEIIQDPLAFLPGRGLTIPVVNGQLPEEFLDTYLHVRGTAKAEAMARACEHVRQHLSQERWFLFADRLPGDRMRACHAVLEKQATVRAGPFKSWMEWLVEMMRGAAQRTPLLERDRLEDQLSSLGVEIGHPDVTRDIIRRINRTSDRPYPEVLAIPNSAHPNNPYVVLSTGKPSEGSLPLLRLLAS